MPIIISLSPSLFSSALDLFIVMRLTAVVVLTSLLIADGGGLFEDSQLRQEAASCPDYPLPSANASDLLSKLQPFLTEAATNISAALKADDSPGGAVVNLVYNDTVIWTKGFGLINDSEPRRGAPDGNTAFRIGSITKVFTTAMMLILRDKKLLESLDDDITKYLPQFKIINPFETDRGITFRQLSSHMAGLPRNPPCPNLFITGCNLTYNEIYGNLAAMELMFPPGEQPQYSNLGFGLLGRVLEKIQGPTWEDQVDKMVFQPLKMNNSGNMYTPQTIKRLAVGYYPDGTRADLIDIGWDAPAGQMYASTNDLAQLMKMLFRPDSRLNPDKEQILDGETIREWMQPAYKYVDGTGFGYPWELKPLGEYILRTKDGAINGYNAEFQMAPEIKTGFIFLHSCDGCSSHAKIISIAQDIILETSKILSTIQPGPSVPPNPSEYVGVYSANQGTVNVTLVQSHGHQFLLGQQDSYVMIMSWTGGDSFQLSVQGIPVPCYVLGSGHVGERVYFQREDSKVTSLTIPGLEYGLVYMKKP